MSKTGISSVDANPRKQTRKRALVRGKTDWERLDALTDEEIHAAVRSDPDAAPIWRPGDPPRRRSPQSKVVRMALRMTQEEFAETFQIPIGTLRDWEQFRTEPDEAAKSYVKVIAYDPEYVKKALASRPGEPSPGAKQIRRKFHSES